MKKFILLTIILLIFIIGCNQNITEEEMTLEERMEKSPDVSKLSQDKKFCNSDSECALGKVVLIEEWVGSFGCFNREHITEDLTEDRCVCYDNKCSAVKK